MKKSYVLEPLRWAAMGVLFPAEKYLTRTVDKAIPSCFVIGAPRSGTTLLYEALITKYKMAYFSNLAHRLYWTPAAATYFGRREIESWRGNFTSKYGHVSGWGAPNEGGRIWKRWIPEEHYLDELDLVGRESGQLQAVVAAVVSILAGPFVSKNVVHSVQMRLLDAIFPGCLFIHIVRNKTDNIRSLVRARESVLGEANADRWISVKPNGWESFSESHYVLQCAAQVLLTDLNIQRDGSSIGSERIFRVNYEAFCRKPNTTVDQLRGFLCSGGLRLEKRIDLPEFFPCSTGQRLSEPFEDMIEQFLASNPFASRED